MINNPSNIIVHHSFTPKIVQSDKAEASFNENHRQRGFPISQSGWYIGYHYVIYGNGEIRQYRQDNEVGAHTKEQAMNFNSIGVCLSGNFDVELPSDEQIATLTKFLNDKCNAYKIDATHIYPHRHFATYKSCYGKQLDDDWARNLLKTNMKFKEQILVLFSSIPQQDQVNPQQDQVKKGISSWIQKVADKTNNEYIQEITYAETPAIFHTIHAASQDGSDTVFANPDEIAVEGNKIERALGKEFDAVCLIYNDSIVVGDKPNHPVDTANFNQGFNAYSIPLSWISSLGDPVVDITIYPTSVEEFFSHEGSHSKFFLVNLLKGLELRDKTHDWYTGKNPMNYPDAIYYFLDYLLELKPYWDVLARNQQPINRSENMFINHNGTYYGEVSGRWIGVATDGATFNKKWPNAKVVSASDDFFNSLDVEKDLVIK